MILFALSSSTFRHPSRNTNKVKLSRAHTLHALAVFAGPLPIYIELEQSTLRPTLYRKTGNYIHSGNTTQIYTDRVTAQPQSHAHYYIWSACCIYSSTKSKYSSSMDFFQFSRPHNSKRLDCLYSMLEPCILSVVWTLEKPST